MKPLMRNITCISIVLLLTACSGSKPQKQKIISPGESQKEAEIKGLSTSEPKADATVPYGASALDVLKSAGLAKNTDFSSVEFIPNSNKSMIVASMATAPCRMIFRMIKTENASYWMPNQIACNS